MAWRFEAAFLGAADLVAFFAGAFRAADFFGALLEAAAFFATAFLAGVSSAAEALDASVFFLAELVDFFFGMAGLERVEAKGLGGPEAAVIPGLRQPDHHFKFKA
ncbi:MAG: hypothetical protein ACFB21_09300 [Opitutales bacterium]